MNELKLSVILDSTNVFSDNTNMQFIEQLRVQSGVLFGDGVCDTGAHQNLKSFNCQICNKPLKNIRQMRLHDCIHRSYEFQTSIEVKEEYDSDLDSYESRSKSKGMTYILMLMYVFFFLSKNYIVNILNSILISRSH